MAFFAEIQKEDVRWSQAAATLTAVTNPELEDEARLHYSRVLWKNPRTRKRLLYVWEHPDHLHRERFEENRRLVVGLLEDEDPEVYVNSLTPKQWSLRTLTREIPSVIWKFWDESKEVAQKSL